MIFARTLILFLFFLVFGCNNNQNGIDAVSTVKKKYSISECVVRLDFQWGSHIEDISRREVIVEISEQINKATVSGEFPLFSAHTTRDSKYYVIYYADKCEQRKQMAQELVEDFFLPNIKNFPEYRIQDKNVKPGFDGVMPSGWWNDA